MPAQLTRMSIRPNSRTQWSISASAVDSSEGEPAKGTAWPPSLTIADAVSAAAWGSRPFTTTPAPHAASSSETARPMPRLPPTTTAARPASRRSSATPAPFRFAPLSGPNYSPDTCPAFADGVDDGCACGDADADPQRGGRAAYGRFE